GRDVLLQELSSFTQIHRGFELADTKQLSIFPNARSNVIGADPTRIGPGMNRHQICRDRRGNMHGAAINADDEGGSAQQPDKLQKAGLVRQIHAILRSRKFPWRFAHDNNTGRCKRATKFEDYVVANRLVAPAGIGMKKNESGIGVEARWLIAGRYGKAQFLACRYAKNLS